MAPPFSGMGPHTPPQRLTPSLHSIDGEHRSQVQRRGYDLASPHTQIPHPEVSPLLFRCWRALVPSAALRAEPRASIGWPSAQWSQACALLPATCRTSCRWGGVCRFSGVVGSAGWGRDRVWDRREVWTCMVGGGAGCGDLADPSLRNPTRPHPPIPQPLLPRRGHTLPPQRTMPPPL